jgi:hypothetical protein
MRSDYLAKPIGSYRSATRERQFIAKCQGPWLPAAQLVDDMELFAHFPLCALKQPDQASLMLA